MTLTAESAENADELQELQRVAKQQKPAYQRQAKLKMADLVKKINNQEI